VPAPIQIRTTPPALAVICAEWLPQRMMFVRTDGSVAFGDRRVLRLVLPDGSEVDLEGQAVQITIDERGQHVGFRLVTLTPEVVSLLEAAGRGGAPARSRPMSSVHEIQLPAVPPPLVTAETQVLLERLAKGLREVQVPAHLTNERRWTAILQPALDILRTTARPEVMKELVLETFVRLPAVSPAERIHLERELVARIPRSPLFGACRLLASELTSLLTASGGAANRRVECAVRLISHLSSLYGERLDEEGVDLLRALHARGEGVAKLFGPELREWIAAAPFLGATPEQVEGPLAELDAIADPVQYHESVGSLQHAAELLIERGAWGAVSALVARLQSHRVAVAAPFDTRGGIAASVLDRLCSGERLKAMVRALASAPSRQERELVAVALKAVGAPAMTEVLELLKRSGERGVRLASVQILQAAGPAAREAVLRALREPEEEWFVTRNLVALLGELGLPGDAAQLKPFIQHAHEQVRRDTLDSAARLLGAGAEPLLLRALSDPSRVVQGRAIRLLGHIGCKTPDALKYLRDVLEDREVPDEDRDLLLAAIEAVAHLGDVQLPGGGTTEELVVTLLKRSKRIGISNLLASAGALWRTDEVRGALCGTLGQIGGEKAEGLLRKIAYDAGDPVAKRAEEAIFAIAARQRKG
jgi:HEAT repeat protein